MRPKHTSERDSALLGLWWIANPSNDTGPYVPPDPSECVPGTLREVTPGEFLLETIGFLGGHLFEVGPSAVSRADIWGTDRDGTSYSLLNNLRVTSVLTMPHVSDGHEDWNVGWLTKGNVWVTREDEYASARLRIDDLHAWALYGRDDNFEFDQASETARINLSAETLGTTTLDDTRVSLIRQPHGSWGNTGRDSTRQISFDDTVQWKIEGPMRLHTLVEEWIGPLESFIRFMTMRPSVVTHIDCHLGGTDGQRQTVELVVPTLQRDDQPTNLHPRKYLTTLATFQQQSIDPMDILATYWQKMTTGSRQMAMWLHLESQDRLLGRSVDSSLLNAIRSIESLYAAQNPTVRPEDVSVQTKINEAIHDAGDVGTQILDAWPELATVGQLRRDVAHGRGQPAAGFGLRCSGGARALRWIQRVRLLTELGISHTVARTIVSDNFEYSRTIETLERWSAEL